MKFPQHLKLLPLTALLLSTAIATHAQTLPTGMSVVAGQVQSQLSGKQLTITNSNNAILNWQSFSIGAGNSVKFVQPSSTSQVLNRVTGNDPSSIFGSLSSNGRVWLLNPNGVLFGQGARIDVASLVTSTLNISNSDWLAGRMSFSGGLGASVENQGEIRSASGGRVALIGDSVTNSGTITADGGQIILAAGKSVELVDTGAPNLAVKVSAPSGHALNLGRLNAGRVDVMAAAVNQQGLIEASDIVLQADGRLTLSDGSATRADGANAGSSGGKIELLGHQIDLQNGSAVSANGASGGGIIYVGGGAQGKDASVPNADAVYFAPGASISADALNSGDGGHIVLWSNTATRAFGSLSAHAGANGGNGGFIETSGGWLAAQPSKLDVSAPLGKAGTWLLDPYNITIVSNGTDSNFDASFTATGNDAVISTTTIANALSAGSNVTISTSGAAPAGAQAGTITMNSAAITAFGSGSTLTLNADSDILMNGADISSGSGSLNLVLHAGLGGTGAVSLIDSNFTVGSGNITLQGTGHAGQADGVFLSQAYLSAGSTGNILIAGTTAAAGGRGVVLDAGMTGNYLSGNQITLNGTSASGDGVQINDGTVNAFGALGINGSGGARGVAIVVGDPTVNPITLSGLGFTVNGQSTSTGYGVLMDDTAGLGNSNSPILDTSSGSTLSINGSNLAGGSPALALLGPNDSSSQVGTLGLLNLSATGGGMLLNGVGASSNPSAITATSDADLTWRGVGFSPAGAVSLHGASVTLDNVDLNMILSGSITVTSDTNLTVSNSYLVASDASAALPITLKAGAAGAGGAMDISYSTLYSAGGPILITNANSPGSSGSTAGISFVESSVQADAGSVQINGVAGGSGAGILLDMAAIPESGVSINGGDVQLVGQSAAGNGIDIRTGSLNSSNSLTLSGQGGASGVSVVGDATLGMTGQLVAAAGQGIFLNGTSTGTGYGVLVDTQGGATAPTFQRTQFLSIAIGGRNSGGATPAVQLVGTSGQPFIDQDGDLSITVPINGPEVLLRNISQAPVGNFLVSGANELIFDNSSLIASTGMTLDASNVVLTNGAQLGVTGSGGLLVAGASGTVPAATFSNQAGANAISVGSSGRWIIWLGDATQSSNLQLGGLSYNFKRYGATDPTAWASDFGNGIVSAATETATLGGTVASRAYDGTTAATLSGLTLTAGVAGDQVGSVSTYTADYADKNAGTGKAVTVNFSAAPEFMDSAGHQVFGYTVQSGSVTGDITPAILTGTARAPNKVYDATTATSVTVGGVSGFVGSETVNVAATGAFIDKNVGTAKTVNVNYQLSDGSNGGLASNYLYQPSANSVQANITPASISFTATAASKIYDGTVTASLSGISITPLGTDQITVSAGTTSFVDANVGTGKTVTASGFSLSGPDAGNYTLSPPANAFQASITPATLTYLAQAVQLQNGAPLPVFTGSVSGFVNGETQQTATSGTLAFSATVSDSSVPGSYGINGQGLAAANYQFVQAPSNATALTVNGSGPAADQNQASTAPLSTIQSVPMPQPTDPQTTGLVNLMPVPQAVVASATPATFDSLPISDTPAPVLAAMLDARANFMQQVLGNGLGQLQQNPGLADVSPCKNLKEAMTGTCLVTDTLKREARRIAAISVAAPTPTPTPVAPGAKPAPTAPAPQAEVAAAPQALTPLFSARRVKTAALPEIHRKVAVLIGEGAYQDASIPSLANAVGDAHALAEVLTDKLGYETLVLDNPSKETVISTLNRLALEMSPEDSVMIYYAGHGAQVDASGQGYWIMSNSDAGKAQTWLSNADIGRLIGQVDVHQIALISDSCYSGSLVAGERIRGTPGKVDPNVVLTKRTAVVMSSGGNEPVFDSGRGGHSLFAWTLMNNIKQVSSWQLGGNLFERVRFGVARELPQRPQYGAAPGYQAGGDYLFEARELETGKGDTKVAAL
ncbi:MAG TPA: YDG domain-containing protein [Burkholderiaceae bacterium]|jgi:filamentous hemagglutinin family protein